MGKNREVQSDDDELVKRTDGDKLGGKPQLLPSMIKNKEKRSSIKHEDKVEKKKNAKASEALEGRALELGEELPSIENTRDADETVCKRDDEESFSDGDDSPRNSDSESELGSEQSDSSEDEVGPLNTIGNVPLVWYKDEVDDEEEDDLKDLKKVKDEVEMEEGEIRDFDVVCSDDEDGDGDVVKGPIRSKNEVQDLPLVPPVSAIIQPHHQTLPVGVVLTIMGAQVIVEGVENHNPLSEGSILWITESRTPLGIVDEIFGPVKNPYYMVRYNSETEVPTGIEQGSLISFVPEFADYVLNNNNLYRKGYDASGENDEELCDELEFSDDEKEAEYKKMIKMSKRGSSEQKNGNTNKGNKLRHRGGNWNNDHRPPPISQIKNSSSGPHVFLPGGPTSGPHAFSLSRPPSGPQTFSPSRPNNGPQTVSPGGPTSGSQAFSPGPQTPKFTGPPSRVWSNGFLSIQPQNIGFPQNGLPSNMPFMQQNFTEQPFQPFQNLAMPNLAQLYPQFNNNVGQMFPSNFVQGVPLNFGANPGFVGSWPNANMLQNNFNPSQIGQPMLLQNNFNKLHVGPPMGFTDLLPNGPQMENNGGVRPPFVAGTGEISKNSNQGNPNQGNGFSSCGGRKPFQRGGGRFRGGRSGPQFR